VSNISGAIPVIFIVDVLPEIIIKCEYAYLETNKKKYHNVELTTLRPWNEVP
jgi:hypothetical protein